MSFVHHDSIRSNLRIFRPKNSSAAELGRCEALVSGMSIIRVCVNTSHLSTT
ncbi:Uncharacterised protein [Vibrio cholerae]|nr:Uncharacterised protein [Vibrio cholerae]